MMSGIDAINRALTQLDAALRGEKITLQEFRDGRRRLIEDYENGSCTTEPDALVKELIDQDITTENPSASGHDPSDHSPVNVAAHHSNPGVLLGLAIVVLIGMIGIGWLFLGDDNSQDNPAQLSGQSPQPLPLAAVNELIDSAWTEQDIEHFLERWKTFDPAAIKAASDDPRLWLLRGEIENRQREARDAKSLGESDEIDARLELIEQLQAAISKP